MLLGTLCVSLLGDTLSYKVTIRAGEGVIGPSECKVKVKIFNVASTNSKLFWKGKHIYLWFLRYNLPPRINERKFVVNIDHYLKRGAHYIALYE